MESPSGKHIAELLNNWCGTYNGKHPKRRKKAQKAIQKLKTLEGRQLRELRAKLRNGLDALLDKELGLYERVLAQGRTSSNKIYSLHKPFTACIASAYHKQKKRRKFGRRAANEPVISHLKTDHRMAQNYLHGEKSPKINAILAAAGWNFKKLMQKLKEKLMHQFLFAPFFLLSLL